MAKSALAELLSLAREIKGMSLRDVEKKTGISNACVSQAENGQHQLSFARAVRLADCYGISLERMANAVRKGADHD